ncbi:MAG: alpha/beta fold hydrolase [Janthinobacterium lividum]
MAETHDPSALPGFRRVRTATLEVGYLEHGPPEGPVVVLLHGFPDDVHAYDDVAPMLVEAGCRVVVPWLRGYGPTRFLDDATPRSGQQAALGADLRDLLDALGVGRAVLAGYDWGGRAACIVAALWPERVAGLLSLGGYNLQDIEATRAPADPEQERRLWYQWYLHTERGVAGLRDDRRRLCRALWRMWSPGWAFSDAEFERTAASFDNPDFVDVVVQSYRHRHSAAEGDPALEGIERALAATPAIGVPSVVLEGATDGVHPPHGADLHAAHFTGAYRRAVVPGVGHFMPREAPEVVARAVLSLVRGA